MALKEADVYVAREAAWLDSLSERKRKHMHGAPSEEKNEEEMDTVTGSGTWEALS